MSDEKRSASPDLRERVEAVRCDHAPFRAEIERLERENGALRAALESNQRDAQAIKAELPALRDDIDRLRGEVERYENESGALPEDRSIEEVVRAWNRDCAALIRAEKTVEDLQRFLERAKARATHYRGALEKARPIIRGVHDYRHDCDHCTSLPFGVCDYYAMENALEAIDAALQVQTKEASDG